MKVFGIAALLAIVITDPLPAQTVTVFDTVFFSDEYGERIATIYLPDSSASNGVGVALGHWWTGDRQRMRVWAESLAASGYTAMAFDYFDFNYRTTICKYPKPVTTFKRAVEFLRRGAERFHITTGKVAGLGQSEGAIHWGQSIVWDNDDVFFGTDPAIDDRLDAAVLIYGAYDTEHFLSTTSFHLDSVWNPYFSENPGLRYTKGNAIANVENVSCPVILFHGTRDDQIRYEHSVAFHDSLVALGMVAELHLVPGAGHPYDVPLLGVSQFTAQGLVTKDLVLRFLEMHLLLPTNMAAGEKIDVHPTYVYPLGDTLHITGEIRNPGGHPVTVRAFIGGIESSFRDSIELVDDGQHGDGVPGDNLFGGTLEAFGLEEDVYRLHLVTHDGSLDQSHTLRKSTAFTTIGPIVIDSASRVALPDTVFWGEEPLLWVNLRNLGSVRTAQSVLVRLESMDSSVMVPTSAAPFGDLAPGGTGLDTPFKFWFDPTCTVSRPIRVVARIVSGEYEFWRDTLSFVVIPNPNATMGPEGLPLSYDLRQNYPNPFNPTTTIEYTLPHSGYATLSVYNVLGEQVGRLVDEEQPAGTFKATWDAYAMPSGVYFYRLTAGQYVQTKKMVLMK